jgi:hypothetical protein
MISKQEIEKIKEGIAHELCYLLESQEMALTVLPNKKIKKFQIDLRTDESLYHLSEFEASPDFQEKLLALVHEHYANDYEKRKKNLSQLFTIINQVLSNEKRTKNQNLFE